MRCGIVKMHSWCWGTHTARCAGAGKAARVFFTKGFAVELFPGWEPVNEDFAMDAEEYCEHGFRGWYCTRHSDRDPISR
jgi:hypothetical protein